MAHEFNRYNQGFGKFGPLEQCSDGELMYVSDHEEIMDEFMESYDRYVDVSNDLEDALKAQIEFLDPFFNRFWWSIVANFFLVSALIGTLGHYHGH